MYETLDEYSLINNGLQHAIFELELENPSYARVARELHQVFYRAMISALKGTANIFVLESKFKDGPVEYQKGTSGPKRIKKGPNVNGCSYPIASQENILNN